MTDTDDPNWLWPDETHDLSVPASSYYAYSDIAWHRGKGMYGRIAGYREAAEVLYRQMIGSQSIAHLDTLIYPFASCWIHHVELHLKALMPDLRRLASRPNEQIHTHNLKGLWTEVRELLEQLWPDDTAAIPHVDRVITQLHAMDPHGQAFLYDRDRKGNPTLASIDQIDLPAFQRALLAVSNFLGGAEAQADNALEMLREAERY